MSRDRVKSTVSRNQSKAASAILNGPPSRLGPIEYAYSFKFVCATNEVQLV